MDCKRSFLYRATKAIVLSRIAPFLIPPWDVKLPMDASAQPGRLAKISFCTACMGRAHHLKRTVPKNLRDNSDYPQVEFVLLNYGSPDDMHEWVGKNLGREMAEGTVA